MTETKETTEKTLRGAAPRKPLSLKRTVESGHVRQSFSHGRSKSVVVEKKKKRTISGPGGAEGEDAATPQTEAERLLAEVMQRPGGLSTDELDARRRALEAAKERAEAEERERARLEALRPPSPSRSPRRKSRAAPAAAEPQVGRRGRGAGGGKAGGRGQGTPGREGQGRRGAAGASSRSPSAAARALEVEPEVEDDVARQEEGRQAAQEPGQGRRRAARAHQAHHQQRLRRGAARAFAGLADAASASARSCARPACVQPRDKVMREVIIPEVITIQELANRMTERSVDVIKLLMGQGAMHKINDVIDADTAELIVREFGHTPKRVSEADVEEGFIGQTDDGGEPAAARARRHHHGPRRPRQDLAARRHPPDQRCRPARPAASRSTSAPIR